jgi:hypothetical protein
VVEFVTSNTIWSSQSDWGRTNFSIVSLNGRPLTKGCCQFKRRSDREKVVSWPATTQPTARKFGVNLVSKGADSAGFAGYAVF